MRRQELRSRTRSTRPAKKIMLSDEEHSIIATFLPKGYSLVFKSDLQDHLKHEQTRKESKSKKKGKPQAFSAVDQPKEQQTKVQIPSNTNLNAQRDNDSTSIVKESAADKQTLARYDTGSQQSQGQKTDSKPKSTLDKASSSLVNKAINDMINHASFAPIYNSRQKTPEILEQIDKIKKKAKRPYMLDTFQEDVGQLLQLCFSHHGRIQWVEAFERLVQTKILQCSKQLVSIEQANAREKEEQPQKPKNQQIEQRITRRRNQEKKAQKCEESSIKEGESKQELKRPNKKKEEKGNKPQETDDSVSQSESFVINLPKKKGRPKFQEIPPRSKCSKILNSQVASLGYNFAKLKSEELYDIVVCLSGDKNLNMSQVSSEITVDLQQLSALQFVQLQAHVKNLLKSRNVEYEILVDSDEDFVIEDDQ